jgi:long-chain fatty acid transport protein
MKKIIKLTVVTAMALSTTSAFATNGSNLIGMGVKTRGMGGAGIGVSHGAESGLTNPALITKIQSDNEISFGGTVFMPDVKNDNGLVGMGAGGSDDSGSADSDSDLSIIPEVSIVSKINENFYFGIGMWGTAGMGVDYDNSGQMEMSTNLQLMQFGVPLAYTTSGFSIAITPPYSSVWFIRY